MDVRSLTLTLVLVLSGTYACDSKSGGADATSEPTKAERRVRFESDSAPYSVELPTGWRLESQGALNKHADLKASKRDRLFLIVIPQELPKLKGIEGPDVESLKEASLARMKKNVDNLQIEREGPVTLETGDGVSVFAEGRADGDRVQYVATYVTHGRWGYQIVAWGPPSAQSALVDEVDAIIKGWQFSSDSLPSERGDTRTGDTSEQSDD